MHNIELTEEHKSKLLEMCKVLFPKYNNTLAGPISFHHNNLYPGMLFGFLNTNDSDSYNHCDLFIHWFEFCSRYIMTELDELYTEKILDPVDRYGKSNNYGRGPIKNYPKNWSELWDNRIFYKYNSNNNGIYPKKHPINYLYKEFNNLKSLI